MKLHKSDNEGLQYVGDGSFLPGVPARDLNELEVIQYGGRKRLLASRLYVESKPDQRAEVETMEVT